MPRQAGINAPGALQHIIIRGIERRAIFKNDTDLDDFIDCALMGKKGILWQEIEVVVAVALKHPVSSLIKLCLSIQLGNCYNKLS